MSFVDLATLTFHRRHELEGRIKNLDQKCNRAIEDLNKMKMKAHSFVNQLNCEPTELKDKFLTLMKTLDEYTYLVTDFNLAITQLDNFSQFELTSAVLTPKLSPQPEPTNSTQLHAQSNSANLTPAQLGSMQTDTKVKSTQLTPSQLNSTPLPPSQLNSTALTQTLNPYNLIDALSEPAPSTSCTCTNNCPPEKPKKIRVPKEEQTLIIFSSSTSSESMPSRQNDVMVQQVTKEIDKLTVKESQNNSQDSEYEDPCKLPAMSLLKADHSYEGTIMTVVENAFWIVVDPLAEVRQFMIDMTNYYMSHSSQLAPEDFEKLTTCAYFDEDSECFYRALFLKLLEESVELFVIDTGEERVAPRDCVQPLAAQFCDRAPYARCCYLAGIELIDDTDKKEAQKKLISRYIGQLCIFEVDDDTSEVIGVYVRLENGMTINDLLVRQGLAVRIDPVVPSPPRPIIMGPPEMHKSTSTQVDFDIVNQPEHEDPVEAVTGYHNRDEADICKHYKGGPDKTCFKGSRCTKRHVLKHPDGWTLDRVQVPAKLATVPLPAPGEWLQVVVTHVCHYDRFYVQLYHDTPEEMPPQFGVVLPPTTLKALQRDLNSRATVAALKPLTLRPSPGELVLALYPLDECWYRARVLSHLRSDQSVEVRYVDYGTVLFVKEDQIRAMEARFMVLPAQAVMCVLAGVSARSDDSAQWARAKATLADMVQDKRVAAHVIARDFNEVTLELIGSDGYNIAHQLAALELVNLQTYTVILDSPHKLVVP